MDLEGESRKSTRQRENIKREREIVKKMLRKMRSVLSHVEDRLHRLNWSCWISQQLLPLYAPFLFFFFFFFFFSCYWISSFSNTVLIIRQHIRKLCTYKQLYFYMLYFNSSYSTDMYVYSSCTPNMYVYSSCTPIFFIYVLYTETKRFDPHTHMANLNTYIKEST